MKYSVLVICLLGFALPCWATTFTFDKGADSSNIKTIVASTISGRVYRQPSDNIQNAVVSLFSGSTLIDSKTTGTDGLYSFSGLTTGQTYTISVSKTNDPLQGVNALDLVLVQRHILNITKLTGYKLYSADVNNNRTIAFLRDLLK